MQRIDEAPGDDVGLADLLDLQSDLGSRVLAAPSVVDALQAVVSVVVERVPGIDAASVTRRRAGVWETVAATTRVATEADRVQYELGSGPCLAAIESGEPSVVPDLRRDARWQSFGRRAGHLGVAGVLSVRLYHHDAENAGGLNMYASRTGVLGEAQQLTGLLVASQAATALAAVESRERADHLERALTSSREIGAAMGVLMATQKVTRETAFSLLRTASQRRNRKLADIAADVVETGTLLPRRES